MVGLTSSVAADRLRTHGPNALPAAPRVSLWRRLLRQFASPLIYLLLFALAFDVMVWAVEGADGWPVEAVAIGLILLLNAGLGLYQEQRSEAALARLAALAGAHAWVLRDGQYTRLATSVIVPDDVVRLDAGDRVPADGRLLESRAVMVDESMLTGESVPVDKADGDEVLSGTLLVRGTATLEVTRTGGTSAMGRLAHMLGSITAAPTPLERRVDALGRRIAWVVVGLAVTLGVAGVVAEGWHQAPQMVVFAVALAVAAVPEGLPAVLTVALALGVERMARRRAVVRRLAAVEALGSVDVIATDKTGTLTENRMDVHGLDAPDEADALLALVLVNDADLSTGSGDPLDLGLLRHARDRGVDIDEVRRSRPIHSARPFDAAWKFARVTVRTPSGGLLTCVKGAPEVVLRRCALSPEAHDRWATSADASAREGHRVLALASGPGDQEDGLTMLGLVRFWDPPRPEVPEAVGRAQGAGIRVVLITGDHPTTAAAIATRIGMRDVSSATGADLSGLSSAALGARVAGTSVFGRVLPEQKLQIVEALQRHGGVVAMTGDGVNDAPALKRSDVGIAMGQRGSDVSREVADLVLLDDNFATIVDAVEEGRGIYENIQKFLRFLFSTNLSEVLLIATGAALAFAWDMRDGQGDLLLPLTAAQVLWINLMTDGLPALALALDRTPGVMAVPPRPADAPLLDRASVRFILVAGVLKALLALALLGGLPWFGYGLDATRATVFHFMAIGQLLLTYPARHTWLQPLPNRALHVAVLGGVAVQVGAASWPVTSTLLGGAWLPPLLWLVVACSALLAWALIEGVARMAWRDHAA